MNVRALSACPSCAGGLVYSADGRFRRCERCDWRAGVEQTRLSARDLSAALELAGPVEDLEVARSFGDEARRHLRLGRAAVREGRPEEAFAFLQRVLYVPASETQRADAWFWLSAVYASPDEKRHCLEEALRLQPRHPGAQRGLALLDGRLAAAELVDPDMPIALPPPERPVAREHFRCPRCAGRLIFAAEIGDLHCEFCHYSAASPAVQDDAAAEQDFLIALATARGHAVPEYARSFQCHNCGVTFLLGPAMLSVTCPYCDGVYVTTAAERTSVIPPQFVIPFRVAEVAAREALSAWLAAARIAGHVLSPVVGYYLPAWTFDVRVEGDVPGKARLFDDILVPAGRRRAATHLPALADFDLATAVPYERRFLASWPAERYQVTVADASLQARASVVRRLRAQGHRPPYHLIVLSFKSLLLPLWLAHYDFRGRRYDVVVDGAGGTVQGERPARS